MGRLWWDSLVQRVLVLAGSRTKCSKSGSAQHWFGPVNVLSLAGAVSRGSRSKREKNVLEGDEGAEGKKVGAIFLVPGRVRSSRDLGSQ